MPIPQVEVGVREQKVVDVMHHGCITIKSHATASEAIRKMKDTGVSSLVVEPRFKGDAYGIVTRKDIVE